MTKMDTYSQFISKSRYSRYLPEKRRRENWNETVARYFNFMEDHLLKNNNYALTRDLRNELEQAVLNLDVMPSMRAIMTAGKALERDNTAGYNCSYLPIDDPKAFDEAMLKLNSPQEMGSTENVGANNIISQQTQKIILPTEEAAAKLADLVLANPTLRAYIQDTYNMKLFSLSPDDPLAKDDKQTLINTIKPLISYDDQLQTFGLSTTSKYVGQGPSPKADPVKAKEESTSVLSTFSSNYYNDNGAMRSDIPQSEIGKAASALTLAYANVYGDDSKANETRTKLDRASYEFLQAGGNFNDPEQLKLLQSIYSEMINDPDYKLSGDNLTNFRASLSSLIPQGETYPQSTNPLMLGTRMVNPESVDAPGSATSTPDTSSTNTSATDLAKMVGGQ